MYGKNQHIEKSESALCYVAILPTSVGMRRPMVAEQGGVRDGLKNSAGGWGSCQNHSGLTRRLICDDKTHIKH